LAGQDAGEVHPFGGAPSDVVFSVPRDFMRSRDLGIAADNRSNQPSRVVEDLYRDRRGGFERVPDGRLRSEWVRNVGEIVERGCILAWRPNVASVF
jgi:hypothetical protein